MNFTIVIPARLNSSRLPRKALLLLKGKPMIARVVETALSVGALRVVVATDSVEISAALADYPVACVMTDPMLASGTDRIAAAVAELGLADSELVINLQGDEPLTPPACVRQLAELLHATPDAALASLCAPIVEIEELFNPHVVKVVRDAQGFALYFSRAPIPWARDAFAHSRAQMPESTRYFRHIGMYAYRVGFLRAFKALSVAPLEHAESLEQLRALYHGYRIVLAPANAPVHAGVDTQADVERVLALLG